MIPRDLGRAASFKSQPISTESRAHSGPSAGSELSNFSYQPNNKQEAHYTQFYLFFFLIKRSCTSV